MGKTSPQILIGASSSRRLGCWRKISLDTPQSCRISDSESCTCLPGLDRTSRRRLMMSSKTAGSIPGPCKAMDRNLDRNVPRIPRRRKPRVFRSSPWKLEPFFVFCSSFLPRLLLGYFVIEKDGFYIVFLTYIYINIGTEGGVVKM